MQRQFFKLVVLSVLFALSSVSLAATQTIGVVDVKQVINGSNKLNGINDSLKQQFGKRREQVIAMQKVLIKDIKKFRKDSAVMGEKDKEKLQKKIMAKQEALRKAQMSLQHDFMMARSKALKALFTHFKTVATQVAKNNGINILLSKAAVVYSGNGIDLTNKIMKDMK